MTEIQRPSRYSAVAKTLHWVIAALIIAQFVGGKFMTHLELPTDDKFFVFQMHKSFGFVVLALSVVRLIWRLGHPVPALPEGMVPWERKIASATHWFFYGFMLIVPLTGWLYVSAQSGIDTKIFFLVPVFHFPVPETPFWQGVLDDGHSALATAMIGLMLLHVAAALKHHYKDGDDVFLRMLPVKAGASGKIAVPVVTALVALAFAIYLVVMLIWGSDEHDEHPEEPVAQAVEAAATDQLAPPKGPHAWVIAPEATYVELVGQAFGDEKIVHLGDVSASVLLNPLDPARRGRIEALIDMSALDTGDGITTGQLKGAEWFDVETFPTVHFLSEDISGTDGAYVANGTLTIREVSAPVALPFALVVDSGRAVAEGEVTIDRQAFGLGGSGGGVAPNVTVTVHIEADAVL